MEKKEFKYDAFISYRHCELDKFVAENLHRILETYELPKELKKKLGVKHKAFKRVFRDQEELPLASNLEDPIIEALEDSKYLIVICSPRLKDSLWCKKEIETFKKLRGRKNIFCVLVEGEPSESFPEAVTFDYVEKVLPNGKTKKEKKLVEPLAADVRGKNKNEVLKKLKVEKLRLIAPMYNLDYDDLRQRHKIWKQRHMIHVSLGIALASILFLIYSLFMIIKINMQQNVLSEYHAKSLVSQASDALNKDNRYDAVKLSYQALTDFYDIVMPYTPDAEYMLSESLGMYDAGLSYKAISNMNTDGIASYVKSSFDGKFGAVYDESERLTLFNTKTMSRIITYDIGTYYNEYRFTFIGNELFAFVNSSGNISIVNTSDGSLVKEIEKREYAYLGLIGSEDGAYLVYVDDSKLNIYDVVDDTMIGEIETSKKYMKELYFNEDGKYVFAATTDTKKKEDNMTMHVIKVKDASIKNKVDINAGYISGIVTKGSSAYFLLNESVDINFNLVLMSYDYMTGNTNWLKKESGHWGKFIKRAYDESNHLAIVNYDTVNIFDASNGEFIESYSTGEEIINIFSYTNQELYLVFLKNGKVEYVNTSTHTLVENIGKYELNLNKYSKVALSENGFLIIPNNENRVILYELKTNSDVKEEDIELDYIKDESKLCTDQMKEEYNFKNNSLVSRILYDTDEKVMFVNYTNGDIAIYEVESKKLIKTLTNVGKISHYFGKDIYGRIYIGDSSDSYILDKDYNKVGHIKGLCKLEDDKVIITSNKKYYSIKIYTLDDLKNIAKEYLGDFENID